MSEEAFIPIELRHGCRREHPGGGLAWYFCYNLPLTKIKPPRAKKNFLLEKFILFPIGNLAERIKRS